MSASVNTKYLIMGNSAAAIAAVRAIRETDAAGSVLMVSPEPYTAYGRPLISYLLEGKVSEAALDYVDDDFYTRNGIDTLFGPGSAVVALEAAAHTATLQDGTQVVYERALCATGSTPVMLDIPGLDQVRDVFPFITLDDAKAALAATQQATQRAHEAGRTSRVLVLGGGYIGCKAAESLLGHADEVLLLQRSRLMRTTIDQRAGDKLAGMLGQRGLPIRMGASITRVATQDGGRPTALLSDGSELPFDVLVMACGVCPNAGVLEAAGAQMGNGVVCGSDMSTSLPHVYAAGDVTQSLDVLDGSLRTVALWPQAVAQGQVAGAHMAEAPNAPNYQGTFPVNAVDFFDISLLTAGISVPFEDAAVQELVFDEGDSYRKFVVRDGLLVGYILLNAPRPAGICTWLIENRVPLDQLPGDFLRDVTNERFPDDLRWERLHKGYPAQLDERGWKRGA